MAINTFAYLYLENVVCFRNSIRYTGMTINTFAYLYCLLLTPNRTVFGSVERCK